MNGNQLFEIKEILEHIFSYVSDGYTYKSICLVCLLWRDVISKVCNCDEFCNHLWTLYTLYPHERWNLFAIMENPNTTLYVIEKYGFYHWDIMSYNPNITWEFLSKYPNKDWHWHHLAKNPNLYGTARSAWELKNWYEMELCNWTMFNPKYPIEKISNPEILSKFTALHSAPNIQLDYIKKHTKIWWSWYGISKNPNLTWEFIKANIDKEWSWYSISSHPTITWDLIVLYPYIKWDWSGISINPNITWQIIQNNPKCEWNWEQLSRHPNITWDCIRNNPTKPWKWSHVSMNPNITWRIVRDNINTIPWNFNYLSQNLYRKYTKNIKERYKRKI